MPLSYQLPDLWDRSSYFILTTILLVRAHPDTTGRRKPLPAYALDQQQSCRFAGRGSGPGR